MATDLDCFVATTQHRQPARVLYHAGFTEDLQRRVVEHIGGEDIATHYGFMQQTGLSLNRPPDTPPLDFSKYWEGETLPEGAWIDGRGVAVVPSHYYHFTGYISPLRNASSLKDIEDYPLEDVSSYTSSHLVGAVADAHAAGRVAVGWVGHIYETAWQLRGYEEFLIDLMDRPAWAQCLMERLADANMIRATAFTAAGGDMLHCGDDVASQNALMFAPEMWRNLFHTNWKKIWGACKAIRPDVKLWYHSDGNIEAIIPELVDAGLDLLNPLQPECMDLDRIHREFGAHLTFDGCIGTQSTMPFGTVGDVRRRVKECIDKYGRDGGLILSPTHVLEPEVPLENIDAMCDACREYGTFA